MAPVGCNRGHRSQTAAKVRMNKIHRWQCWELLGQIIQSPESYMSRGENVVAGHHFEIWKTLRTSPKLPTIFFLCLLLSCVVRISVQNTLLSVPVCITRYSSQAIYHKGVGVGGMGGGHPLQFFILSIMSCLHKSSRRISSYIISFVFQHEPIWLVEV